MANQKIKINLDSLKARREWKRHKVKDGHNIFRIAPPFGENSNGYAYRKWQVIWGLIDPDSGRARPFASSMTSEKRCPITEFVDRLKKKAEAIKGEMQASGASDEAIKERLSSLNKTISDLNPKTVYVYNAVDKSGEVGLLELKSTAHKQMKAEMAQYVADYNQDPTSLNSEGDDSGVWFDIVRTSGASFRDTAYTVKKCQIKTKKAGGSVSFEDDRSPLPDSVVENYDNMAYDLSAIYQVKSYEDLEAILQANLPAIIQNCPDADDTGLAFEQQVLKSPAPKAPVKSTKAVTTRFDDVDDEEEVVAPAPRSKPTTVAKRSVADDDFMAEANALLED